MSYHYFKNLKNLPKIQKLFDGQTKHKPLFVYSTEKSCIVLKRYNENCWTRCILHLLYIIPLFKKKLKNRKKIRNCAIAKKSKSQVGDMLLSTCMKFENYQTKTVEGDEFITYHTLYHYFKKSNILQKYKKCSDL